MKLELPHVGKNVKTAKKGLGYLITEKKIRDAFSYLIDKHIFIDEKGNAVFVCRDINGEPVGAEIESTGFKGMAKGSDRDKGAFYIYQAEPKTLILTESAIDAISYKNLENPKNAIIASTAGVMPHLTQFNEDVIKKYGISSVKIAYDNDVAGQLNAYKMKADIEKKYPNINVEIERSKAKDWNEDLQFKNTSV